MSSVLVSIKPVGESAIDIDARDARKRSAPILRLLTIDFSIAAPLLIKSPLSALKA
jgi:hypothetical protein